VDPGKVAGFEICGMNSTDIGAIKGVASGGQERYLRASLIAAIIAISSCGNWWTGEVPEGWLPVKWSVLRYPFC
jgi:hypothetical protein